MWRGRVYTRSSRLQAHSPLRHGQPYHTTHTPATADYWVLSALPVSALAAPLASPLPLAPSVTTALVTGVGVADTASSPSFAGAVEATTAGAERGDGFGSTSAAGAGAGAAFAGSACVAARTAGCAAGKDALPARAGARDDAGVSVVTDMPSLATPITSRCSWSADDPTCSGARTAASPAPPTVTPTPAPAPAPPSTSLPLPVMSTKSNSTLEPSSSPAAASLWGGSRRRLVSPVLNTFTPHGVWKCGKLGSRASAGMISRFASFLVTSGTTAAPCQLRRELHAHPRPHARTHTHAHTHTHTHPGEEYCDARHEPLLR